MPTFQIFVDINHKNSTMCGSCEFCRVGSLMAIEGPMKGIRSHHCNIFGGKMLKQTSTGLPRRCKDCREAGEQASKPKDQDDP